MINKSQYPPTTKLSQNLINELERALEMVREYGSIEIYVQDSTVTQITVRNITKTKMELNGTGHSRDKKIFAR